MIDTGTQQSAAEMVYTHAADLLLGPVFLFLGIVACALSAIRRRSDVRLLIWFGVFIGLYGLRMLAGLSEVFQLLPGSQWPQRIVIGVDYVLVIPALLFWKELSRGALRRACEVLAVLAGVFTVAGIVWSAGGGSPFTFLRLNLLIAILCMIALGSFLVVPSIGRRFLVVQSWALRIVMPAMALVVMYVNIRYFLGVPPAPYVEPLGFAVWIAAIGYEAAARTFSNELRLVAIENELETARQIQQSILPRGVPDIEGVEIAVLYRPVSSVAGDLYQFLQPNGCGIGVLIADVTGHGVPAALIASMIKMALQSVAQHAAEPGLLMRELNRILTPELAGRLTTAGYLWLDTVARSAQYAAAGHPPLLLLKTNSGKLLRIENNGLLFGVSPDCEYPAQSFPLSAGDRLLMYSDGLIEPEDIRGEAFGEQRLEVLLKEYRQLSASVLKDELLKALEHWQPRSTAQQDDITLVVLDLV